MKNPKLSFRVIGTSGPLSLSWFPGPMGDAVEAENEIGVGFFSPNGELLSVEFDDVEEKEDHQFLQFQEYRVEIWVKSGKVKHVLEKKKSKRAA